MDGVAIISETNFAQEILGSLTSQISVSSIVGVLTVALGACVGLAFMWWGVRKLISALMSAFKKGKVGV